MSNALFARRTPPSGAAADVKQSTAWTATTLSSRLGSLRPQLYKRALSLTSDEMMADDLVQHVFERALRAKERFQEGTNLSAWLRAIMRNAFIDERRRARLTVVMEIEIPCEPPEETPDPLDLVSFEDVVAAAPLLGDIDREILHLATTERRSYREISARMALDVNTIASRIHRLKKKLKRVLSDLHQERLCAWTRTHAREGQILGSPRRGKWSDGDLE